MKFICSNQDEDLEFKPLEVKVSKPKVKSERAELVKFFVDRLVNKDGKPYPARLIAVKLAHIPTKDLYYLQSTCNKAKSFGACFWWSIKPK